MKEGLLFIAIMIPVSVVLLGLVFIDFWGPALKAKVKCTTCRTGYPVSWLEPCDKCKYYWPECNGIKNHEVLCNKHLNRWKNIQTLEVEVFKVETPEEKKEKGLKALMKKLKRD